MAAFVFAAARGLLTVVASLAAEDRLQACRPQQLWLMGPAAPWHVGSSQTRDRTRVPCTGRRTPNHRATREALFPVFKFYFLVIFFENLLPSFLNFYILFFCLFLFSSVVFYFTFFFKLEYNCFTMLC